ncbi:MULTISPECIES: hypothetical protein [Caballeronia]|uniref:Uncharacterized protein n=1 Tax=Burkholderia vietnamiensis (strain G4 / LMG 22486) TaxID=269482 RepID=A4JU81_BURVG|nr:MULTISPECIES: hypothetical protein [Caballeronia]ABO59834.1 hypothetical protein Bcep1808_6947 [Burkholderia vietnamiensis G4]MCB4350004.1 hypothetical protein [Burkholderia vietnamiensis]MDR5798956.1 hypothetical protein [Caballeronia sp. LZ001]
MSQFNLKRRKQMSLILEQHLPIAARCALETFAASGERSKGRLFELLDHYFRATGLSGDENRKVYEDSVVQIAVKRFSLGASEGF